MMPTLQFFFDDFYSGNMGVGWATPQGDFDVTSMELEIHKGKTGEIGVGEYQAYLNRDAPCSSHIATARIVQRSTSPSGVVQRHVANR